MTPLDKLAKAKARIKELEAEVERLRDTLNTATQELARLRKMFSLPDANGNPDRAAVGLLQHALDNINAVLCAETRGVSDYHRARYDKNLKEGRDTYNGKRTPEDFRIF